MEDPYVGDDPEYSYQQPPVQTNTTTLLARIIKNTLTDGGYSRRITEPQEKQNGTVMKIVRAGVTFTVYITKDK